MDKTKGLITIFLIIAILMLIITFIPEKSLAPNGKSIDDGGSEEIYYVSLNGNDANDGSSSTPWKSIQYALDSVLPGDTVIVKTGDYSNQGRIYFRNSGEEGNLISIEAEENVITKGFTVMDTNNWVPVNYIKIKGFEIIADGDNTITGTGIIVSGDNNIIEENIIRNSARQGIYIFSQGSSANNNLIKNNIVENSGESVALEGEGIILWGNNARNNEIIGNEIKYNSVDGIGVNNGSGNYIAENEIYGNGGAGIYIGIDPAEDNIIEYNHVYENCQWIDDRFGIDLLRVGKNNIVRYNLVHEQYDTLNDPEGKAIPNPGNPTSTMYGTGGIRFDGGNWAGHYIMSSLGNKVYYNIIYGEYNGVQIYNFENAEVYNNVVYRSKGQGLSVSGFTPIGEPNVVTGNKIKNNIFYNLDSGSKFVQMIHSENNEINNNAYYGEGEFWYYGDNMEFEEWKTESGNDVSSLFENPKFKSASGKDFRLESTSNLIDRGVDVGLSEDYLGVSIPKNLGVDIGAYETEISEVVCGNGVVESGEECDLENLGGENCVSQGFSGGSLSCSECSFDTSNCYNENVCGDGIIDEGEYCDGNDLNGETCQSLGCAGGTLSCSSCEFNGNNCYNLERQCTGWWIWKKCTDVEVSCEIEIPDLPGECIPSAEVCDGADNDCDGFIDEEGVCFTCTPGSEETRQCGSTNVGVCEYGIETRVCGSNGEWGVWGSCVGAVNPGTENCNNGLDDDCDGKTDSNDSDCGSSNPKS